MAKKITKNINAKFNPTLLDGYNIYNYGGRMRYDVGGMMMPGGMLDMSPYMQDTQSTASLNPVQAISGASQEVGNMVDNFANMRIASNSNKPYNKKSVTGAFVKGISSGGVLGGMKGLMGAYSTKLGNDASQKAYQQNQQDMLKQNLISNLPGQSSYVPTFEMGGDMNMLGGNKEILDRVSSVESNTTHEQSPYGGVPISNNALVEKDEYLYTNKAGKKYVFSNKLFR